MDTELRKRLEEAAEKDWETNFFRGVKNLSEEDMQMCARSTFILGGKWMFREAVALAKEWILNNVHKYEGINGTIFHQSMADDFESDMNKLWEE